jgi:hypothetical protein
MPIDKNLEIVNLIETILKRLKTGLSRITPDPRLLREAALSGRVSRPWKRDKTVGDLTSSQSIRKFQSLAICNIIGMRNL